jgi:hypothetical protein
MNRLKCIASSMVVVGCMHQQGVPVGFGIGRQTLRQEGRRRRRISPELGADHVAE